MSSLKNKEIKAVHIADLKDILADFKQLQDFKDGNIKCYTCYTQISFNNVGSMKLIDDKLVFTCSSVSCYEKIVRNML